MIPASFTSALANHLWQSTILAGVAALLALALRKNHARTRYWLWLIASVKFLIPFSLLVALGSRLGRPAAIPAARPELSAVMQQISQPFPQAQSAAAAAPGFLAQAGSLLPALLLTIWACGFLAVSFSWWRRWRRIRAAVRAGSPLAVAADVPVLSSPALLEPGVFGILRPVLLLPEGITERLAPAHLEAIVAHELCHVRRRDNLAAAVHMAVEAIFWFHPLVWWLGARLVEEREHACDEEVLRLGSRPEVYAESILKTCQFYLESPLTCMSGISGSDLKKRIVRIMTQRLARKLSFGRKVLLAAAGMAAVAGPIVFGLMNAPQSRAQSQPASATPRPSFEAASVKPDKSAGDGVTIRVEPGGRFVAHNVTLKLLMQEAYGVKEAQISGGPGWIDSEHYDIEAKPEDSAGEAMQKLGPDQRKEQLMLMMQSLIEDRFKLTLRHDTKELPVYALVVAKNGPKFHETTTPLPAEPPPQKPEGAQGPPVRMGIMMSDRGHLNVTGARLDMFANVLSRLLGRIVQDQTGLTGRYDFTLKWTPDESQGGMFKGAGGGPPPEPAPSSSDASGPSIFTALQEQLGLKLESKKGAVDTLVIEQVEKPSEN